MMRSFKVAPSQTAPQSKARKMKDKELIQKLFGRYDVSNFPKIIKYMQEFDQKVKPYNNYGKPYFKGTPKFSFYEYLKNQQLNQTPEAIDTVFERLASFTQNLPNWNNPGTMINVVPPVNLASLSVVNYIQGLNSNFAQDTYAGFLITAELEVTKYISDLVGWNWQKSIGVFTFGGKGTSLYATKIALSKCDPDVSMYGCKASNYFILTSATAHPCHYEVCDWLGLGKNSCIEIPCLENGEIDLLKTEKIICNELEKGKIFLGCNLNGGSTNELYIDPIKSVYNLISKISQKYKLTYRPHLHVDSVIGWVYLFFQNYDFTNNPLNINKNSLKKIHFLSNLAQDFKYADSMGIDFHKTGFCPYASSLFLCRERQDYFAMNPAKYQDLQDLEYGNYNPYHTTLELSRPATGAVTALVSLKTLGVEGFQQIYSSMFEASELFRKKLAQDSRVCIINSESCWLASLFILKPENYQNLNLDDIIALDDPLQQEIKNFNINFAKYIQQKACNSEINFVFTSSRSHVIPGTNISLGTLKAYPMSVFFDQYSVVKIIQELKNCIDDYITNYTNNDTRNITSLISDDMVYKEKK